MVTPLWIGFLVPGWVLTGWVDRQLMLRVALWKEGKLECHVYIYFIDFIYISFNVSIDKDDLQHK